jgi:hypothetical protein
MKVFLGQVILLLACNDLAGLMKDAAPSLLCNI